MKFRKEETDVSSRLEVYLYHWFFVDEVGLERENLLRTTPVVQVIDSQFTGISSCDLCLCKTSLLALLFCSSNSPKTILFDGGHFAILTYARDLSFAPSCLA